MTAQLPTYNIIAVLATIALTFTSTLSLNCLALAHPALPIPIPIPNARPPKSIFANRDDTSSLPTTVARGKPHGKAIPLSGTPLRGVLPLKSSASGNDNNNNEAPPSQLESIVLNAKSLANALFQSNPFQNPSLRTTNIKAITAGLAVSLAMVPEAVSFSFVAGVNPLIGLWTTVVLGFFAALFGGRAGIMSSTSGACSVVVAALCATHGPGYLAGCAALAGLLQITAGVAGLGKLIRLVPHPVMLGFVNGLTIVMFRAQLTHFKEGGKFLSLFSEVGRSTYALTALTMGLVKFGIPKLQEKVEAAKVRILKIDDREIDSRSITYHFCNYLVCRTVLYRETFYLPD